MVVHTSCCQPSSCAFGKARLFRPQAGSCALASGMAEILQRLRRTTTWRVTLKAPSVSSPWDRASGLCLVRKCP
jgi:hypothetical protein